MITAEQAREIELQLPESIEKRVTEAARLGKRECTMSFCAAAPVKEYERMLKEMGYSVHVYGSCNNTNIEISW